MGYELHIEREEPITLDEWKAAIARISGIDLNEEDTVVVNPATGQEIRFPAQSGDAIFESSNSSVGLRWSSRGAASFEPPENWDESGCTFRVRVLDLAKQLGAQVVGDEGEEYGL
ncbi:hypothetical protein KQI84_00230 [bacterium]|nr:hypothetical protein [bacterium]